MIVSKGSRELIAALRNDIKEMKMSITKSHQKLVLTMFHDLVRHTPQWSGELALHWGIEVHGKKAPAMGSVRNRGWEQKSRQDFSKLVPYQMGDDPAVRTTVMRELPKISEIRYNSIVKFVNNMPYAEDVARGVGPEGRPIREVNKLAAYGGVAMINYLDMKYSRHNGVAKVIGL